MSRFVKQSLPTEAAAHRSLLPRGDRCLLLRQDSVETGLCPDSIFDICPVSTADIWSQQQTSALSPQKTSVLFQQRTSVPSQQTTFVLSQQQILSVSETWSVPDTSKSPYLDNPKVTFQTNGTPKSRIAVRFQWAWSWGELLKN